MIVNTAEENVLNMQTRTEILISIPVRNIEKMWRLWAKALGEKIGEDKEADTVAIIRTLIVMQAVICNGLIVWNIIRNW